MIKLHELCFLAHINNPTQLFAYACSVEDESGKKAILYAKILDGVVPDHGLAFNHIKDCNELMLTEFHFKESDCVAFVRQVAPEVPNLAKVFQIIKTTYKNFKTDDGKPAEPYHRVTH